MTDKTLIGIAVGVVATPVLAFFLFGGIGSHPMAAPADTKAPAAAETASHLAKTSSPVVSTLSNPPATLTVVGPVTPAALEQLAQSVKLSENESEKTGLKPELWAKAIPIAERLMNEGTADCEQRNWLTQFVATGQDAIAGSSSYYERARFLATLYRNNQELATGIPSN